MSNRIKRAEYLNGNCPPIQSVNSNMYYDFVDGNLLSNIDDGSNVKFFKLL